MDMSALPSFRKAAAPFEEALAKDKTSWDRFLCYNAFLGNNSQAREQVDTLLRLEMNRPGLRRELGPALAYLRGHPDDAALFSRNPALLARMPDALRPLRDRFHTDPGLQQGIQESFKALAEMPEARSEIFPWWETAYSGGLELGTAARGLDEYLFRNPAPMWNLRSRNAQWAANPDLLYFAGAHLRALNALGIERFDAYGAHTGSKIALELALAHPERVRKVIFDGISLRAPEAAAELLSGIEEVDVDHDGSQLMRAWHMVRDAYLFFPWWKHTADACRDLGLPDPVSLHGEVVDLLASICTYHLAYRAALVHSNEERLPLLTVPALVACAGSDQLFPVIDEAAALVPGARKAVLPSRKEAKGLDEAVRVFAEFLDS